MGWQSLIRYGPCAGALAWPSSTPLPRHSPPSPLQGIRTLVLTNATGAALAREQALGRRFNEVWQHYPDVPGFGVQQRAGDPRAAVAPALALAALGGDFSWLLYGDVSAGLQGGPRAGMHLHAGCYSPMHSCGASSLDQLPSHEMRAAHQPAGF